MSMILEDREVELSMLEGLNIGIEEIEDAMTAFALWQVRTGKSPVEFVKKRLSARQERCLAVIGLKYLINDYANEIRRENERNAEEDNKD